MLRLVITLAIGLFAACAHASCETAPAGRYAMRGDTVTDKKSGLTWQRCSVGQIWQEGPGCTGEVKPLTWYDAAQQAGQGWRLPTAKELETLVSLGCVNAMIDEAVFPGMDTKSLNYWSGTPSGESDAYYVNFRTGITSVDARDEPYAVRLVRGGKAAR